MVVHEELRLGSEGWDEAMANGSLIETAPDLLALVEAVEFVDGVCPWCGDLNSHYSYCDRQRTLAQAQGAGAGAGGGRGGKQMIVRTTQKADAVLATVDDLVQEDTRLYLEPYQNGREHGWVLYNVTGEGVAFAENRNSDDIVVYLGTRSEFEMQGNVPSERVWKDRRMFEYDAYYEAAEAIIAHLCDA
jgi:hypothetical protein